MTLTGEFGDMIFFFIVYKWYFTPLFVVIFTLLYDEIHSKMNGFETYESVLMGYEIQLMGSAILRMIN